MRQRFSASGRSTIVDIAKGNGSTRRLYIPTPTYRVELAAAKPALLKVFDRHGGDCVDHAFAGGKNCVTNALCHVGKPLVLSLDMEDFFGHIRPRLVQTHLTSSFIALLFEDDAPRQGLLTSPLVSNLAMSPIDRRVTDLCRSLGDVTYSRYADDLTFSFVDPELAEVVQGGVSAILRSVGLTLNSKKTQLQNARNGIIHITGVALTNDGVRPTRRTLRRIRAAAHQKNERQLKGLKEWALCKLPGG